MIQCPDCRAMIPDESAFCDQCGRELKWCPECKRPKRGLECPVCGSDLIPGRKYLGGGMPETGAPKVELPETQVPRPQATVAGEAEARATALVGNGWRLILKPGEFGRVGGMWPELGDCPYVSGRHGSVEQDADGWTIIDNNSTNGLFVDGKRVSRVRLKKGDRVRIATLDFVVE